MYYKSDCRFFRGDIPCKPHKQYGVHCQNCDYYQKIDYRILIIKLGAIGDVIRTTPILTKIKESHPNAEIWWITYSPEILPKLVDKSLFFNFENSLIVQNIKFDWAINLDKDLPAVSLMNSINAKKKSGFTLIDARPSPLDISAQHKFNTGLFDDISQENTKSYPEEIFEILGWHFNGEEYLLDYDNSIQFEIKNDGKKIIGLNTGCGARWTARLWSIDNWEKLIKLLQSNGYYPLLLGGEAENERNLELQRRTGADYLGYFPLQHFITLVSRIDLLVTGVTMALHLGIGLKKKVVLFNNIFNPNEFELYGRGILVQPEKECYCYFKGKCEHNEYFCMDYLHPETIFEAIEKLT